MPIFFYTALNSQQQQIQGKLSAVDSRKVLQTLKKKKLKPIKIEAEPDIKPDAVNDNQIVITDVFWWQRLKLKQQIFLFQQLALMLRSGLTLLQALDVCAEQTTTGRLQTICRALADEIQMGQSLSQAMAKQKAFTAMAIYLVASAEASGELDTVLENLVDYLEEQQEIKTNLMTSLFYPVIVLALSVVVVVYLAVEVIPSFAKFFVQRGSVLPESTQFLLNVSAFFQHYGVWLLLAITVSVVIGVFFYKTPTGRYCFDQQLLRTPVVGRAIRASSLSQINHSMGLLLSSGLSILESLKIVSGISRNQVLAQQLQQASAKVLQGRSLADSMQHSAIPNIMPHLIKVGEKTGSLDHVFKELSDYFARDLKVQVKRLSAMMEPVLIMVVGSIVGFVYYAFIQALLRLSGG